MLWHLRVTKGSTVFRVVEGPPLPGGARIAVGGGGTGPDGYNEVFVVTTDTTGALRYPSGTTGVVHAHDGEYPNG